MLNRRIKSCGGLNSRLVRSTFGIRTYSKLENDGVNVSPSSSPTSPSDPRIIPAEKSTSKTWNAVLDKLSPPDLEGIYHQRKYLENPNLRKQMIENIRRQQVPHLALVDFIKNAGKTPKLEKPPLTHVDRALGIVDWNDFPEDIETVITNLQYLEKGQDIIILGGGISGLSLAYFLSKSRPDIKIKIIEKSKRLGGYMDSEIVEGNTIFEHGPRTLLPSHPGTTVAVQIMNELGLIENEQLLGVKKRSPTNTKGIVFNNELIELPRSGLKQAINFLFFSPIMKGIKFGAVKDLLFTRPRKRNINDESVESFISRRFNRRLSDRFISALMRGIYAGDVSDLSARSVTRINKMYLLERLYGASITGSAITGIASTIDKYPSEALPLLSQAMTDKEYSGIDKLSTVYSLLALKNGIQSLAMALEKELSAQTQVEIIRGFEVKEIVPIDGGCKVISSSSSKSIAGSVVVSTISAKDVAPLLSAAKKASDICKEVKFSNLATVNFFFPKKNLSKNWFGFLVPKTEDGNNPEQVIGVIFDSSVRNAAEPVNKGLEKILENQKEEELDRLIGVGSTSDIEENESVLSESGTKKKENTDFSFDKFKSFVSDQFSDEGTSHKISFNSGDSGSATGTTLTVMVGGDLWSALGPGDLPSESTVIENSIKALKKYLKIDEEINPEDYIARVTFQTRSIPQYSVGHGDRVGELHEAVGRAYDNRLYLSGTSFGRGVGVSDCILDSLLIASRFSEQRKLLYPSFYINHYLSLTHPSLYA